MFHCPSCNRDMPDNERYPYYLQNSRGRQFSKPLYACGACLADKDPEAVINPPEQREPVPAAFRAAFEGDRPFLGY